MAGDEGFLSRWARRKADAREGKPLVEPEPPKPAPAVIQKPKSVVQAGPTAASAAEAQGGTKAEPVAPPPLTLDDAHALTQHSDFKPFMAQQVSPDVRNAAMKKLFTDPHYNVMDGLDIYIDDYTKSDPIPESMLRQMVGAKFLNLFDDEKLSPPADPRDSSGDAVPASVAQSTDTTEPCLPPDHAHSHLRLQPDHAPAGPDTGSRPA